MTARDDVHWDEMFDLQYEIGEAVKALLTARCDGLPPLWCSMIRCYLIESLAESARFGVELPPRDGKTLAPNDDPRYVPCPQCPHWMHLHTATGCGCGCTVVGTAS